MTNTEKYKKCILKCQIPCARTLSIKKKSSKGVVMMIKAQLKCQIYSQNKCQQDIYWVIKLVEQ